MPAPRLGEMNFEADVDRLRTSLFREHPQVIRLDIEGGVRSGVTLGTISNSTYQVAAFANATTQYIEWHFSLPIDIAAFGDHMIFEWIWTKTTANSGNVAWRKEFNRIRDGLTLASSQEYGSTEAIAVPTQNVMKKSGGLVSLGSLLSLARDDWLAIRLARLGGDGTDTFNDPVYLFGAKITVGRTS